MKKTMSIEEFMRGETKGKSYVKETIILTGATTIAITMFPIDTVLAADAMSGLDRTASSVYAKLLVVGKWIIIIKGAMDTINNAVQGDYQTAKKSFLSYLIVYLILQGLPWAFNEVDNVFKSI